ncbi:hypothetical protein F5J12DRAFT_832646 [Pisolithus orientalis]|uniref:uncharacterized protein n=1 Tax=Pisolithus orientalis TaxID=936130 RepID=UPI00222596CA|nr:uncharacterized protein F5J12DRAFT_832646 [Pisolithus orientalis]KAI6006729.1 hypothetical protein F5J12DRAFT_832646 [Pisolithus orientalis]
MAQWILRCLVCTVDTTADCPLNITPVNGGNRNSCLSDSLPTDDQNNLPSAAEGDLVSVCDLYTNTKACYS